MHVYVYIRYVRKLHTAPVLFNLAFYLISFSTKPTQRRYICVPFGQKTTNNIKQLQTFGPLETRCTSHDAAPGTGWLLHEGLYFLHLQRWHFERENRGDEIRREKKPSRTVKILMKANTHHHKYINYHASLCGSDLVVRFATWKLLKSFTLSTTRWCTSILTKSIHCIYMGCSIDTYFWLMQSM